MFEVKPVVWKLHQKAHKGHALPEVKFGTTVYVVTVDEVRMFLYGYLSKENAETARDNMIANPPDIAWNFTFHPEVVRIKA